MPIFWTNLVASIDIWKMCSVSRLCTPLRPSSFLRALYSVTVPRLKRFIFWCLFEWNATRAGNMHIKKFQCFYPPAQHPESQSLSGGNSAWIHEARQHLFAPRNEVCAVTLSHARMKFWADLIFQSKQMFSLAIRASSVQWPAPRVPCGKVGPRASFRWWMDTALKVQSPPSPRPERKKKYIVFSFRPGHVIHPAPSADRSDWLSRMLPGKNARAFLPSCLMQSKPHNGAPVTRSLCWSFYMSNASSDSLL